MSLGVPAIDFQLWFSRTGIKIGYRSLKVACLISYDRSFDYVGNIIEMDEMICFNAVKFQATLELT